MLWFLDFASDEGAPDVEVLVVDQHEEEAEGVHRHQES